jgi:hypothetical protein
MHTFLGRRSTATAPAWRTGSSTCTLHCLGSAAQGPKRRKQEQQQQQQQRQSAQTRTAVAEEKSTAWAFQTLEWHLGSAATSIQLQEPAPLHPCCAVVNIDAVDAPPCACHRCACASCTTSHCSDQLCSLVPACSKTCCKQERISSCLILHQHP